MKYVYSILTFLIFIGCASKLEEAPKNWQLSKKLSISGINPIGMTIAPEGIWLSDGDHNRLVLINIQGNVLKTIDSLERPMHIDSQGSVVFVPQYGNDKISIFKDGQEETLVLTDTLDAPAGIAIYNQEKAIADFYNHRILYSNDGKTFTSFGKEGKLQGDFYYPTDVQITENSIWVADAYNNRIQVFDKDGTFLKIIGADQKMNAATGIFVSETEVFITDFENDRVLVFDHEGTLKQILSEDIAKPTEIIAYKNQILISNFRTSELLIYDWKVIPEGEENHNHNNH